MRARLSSIAHLFSCKAHARLSEFNWPELLGVRKVCYYRNIAWSVHHSQVKIKTNKSIPLRLIFPGVINYHELHLFSQKRILKSIWGGERGRKQLFEITTVVRWTFQLQGALLLAQLKRNITREFKLHTKLSRIWQNQIGIFCVVLVFAKSSQILNGFYWKKLIKSSVRFCQLSKSSGIAAVSNCVSIEICISYLAKCLPLPCSCIAFYA